MCTVRRHKVSAPLESILPWSPSALTSRHYYAQDELLLALKRQWGDRLGNVAVLDRLRHRDAGAAGSPIALTPPRAPPVRCYYRPR
jgi:hypothetical protein